jgi:hypothetical protein
MEHLVKRRRKWKGGTNQMELDRALELAVVSSWDELVSPGEPCSIHVEYKNVSEVRLNSLEVWMIKKRGYGTLVCSYSALQADSSATLLGPPGTHFANSYRSGTLAGNLDFIMRNQHQFSRPIDHSIHGFVQVDSAGEENREEAALWCRSRIDSPENPGAERMVVGDAVCAAVNRE